MEFFEKHKEVATNSDYMKMKEEGLYRCRILSAPVNGWEDWAEDKKPIRHAYSEDRPESVNPKKPCKEFWSMVVWNYNESKIQVWHITQKSIREQLKTLNRIAGSLANYDIKITRMGEELNTTKYTLVDLEPRPVAESIKQAFHQKRCNLNAIFTNDDPFDRGHRHFTHPVFEGPTKEEAPGHSSFEELKDFLDGQLIETEMLHSYVEQWAQSENSTVEKTAAYALSERMRGSFKDAYKKWLTESVQKAAV